MMSPAWVGGKNTWQVDATPPHFFSRSAPSCWFQQQAELRPLARIEQEPLPHREARFRWSAFPLADNKEQGCSYISADYCLARGSHPPVFLCCAKAAKFPLSSQPFLTFFLQPLCPHVLRMEFCNRCVHLCLTWKGKITWDFSKYTSQGCSGKLPASTKSHLV